MLEDRAVDPINAAQVARVILSTLNARDPYTLQHGLGTGRVAALIAQALDFDEEHVQQVRLAAELHDMGKISVPDEILVKPGRLDRDEFQKVKEHPRVSADILARIPELASLADIILHHHEYWDGKGYPDGLAGESIPLEARIICVADAFDAMTHDRPYRKRMSHESACEEINRLAGTQFCPTVVDALNRVSSRLYTEQEKAAPSAAEVAPSALLTLDGLGAGKAGLVRSIAGDVDFRRRLLEVGVVPGTKIAVTKVAPMGDPVEVEIRGARFFLRKAEAAHVLVDPLLEGSKVRERRMHHAPVSRTYHLAVVGNPNTGKTTLFNALTGASGRVGNYPGITVERLTAQLELSSNLQVELVDVPGTYSLATRSRDEQVAMEEILGRAGSPQPDLLVVVLNATHLERSLYLLLQLQEFGFPIIAAVNMMDEAWKQHLRVDLDALSVQLDVPFIGVTARTGDGVERLRQTIEEMLLGEIPRQTASWRWSPSEDLTSHLDQLVPAIGDLLGPDATQSRRRAFALWCLMSLSENDDLLGVPEELRRETIALLASMREDGHDLDLEVTRERYEQIDRIVKACTNRDGGRGADVSRRIDSVVTHPLYGMIAFLLVMAVVFAGIFEWATPMMDAIEGAVGWAGGALRNVLPEGLLADFLLDGVVAGVGSVLVFLPQILILFLCIAVLEHSGYLSRAAFMIDRLMRALGLNGKAFVPMLSGYACAIPAIMATRTLESRRDRLLTMMVIPLMSCSARLPVYTLIIASLFPAEESVLGPISLGMLMLFGLYVVATIIALIAAGVLGKYVIKGESQPLLMELPPYRFPPARDVLVLVWGRTRDFLVTAGTVILVASIVLWAALTFPRTDVYSQDYDKAIATAQASGDEDESVRFAHEKRAEELQNSLAGRLGRVMEPFIEPLGFDWKIGIGLIGSFAAREVFVSTMGQVYAVGEADEESATLRAAMKAERRRDGTPVYTPLTGMSLLIFFMLALQCVSTVAVVRQESGGWKWPMFQIAYTLALAYGASLVVYQGGKLLGFD
jgi:ferrous iron transport protein B